MLEFFLIIKTVFNQLFTESANFYPSDRLKRSEG